MADDARSEKTIPQETVPVPAAALSSDELPEKPVVQNVEVAAVLGNLAGEYAGVEIPAPGTAERRAIERRLVRKIDFTMLPLIVILFILNYLDRNNIAAAKLSTFVDDLKLSSTEYSCVVSIMFVSYILMQIPSNLILARITRPNYYLPFIMIMWGIFTTLISKVNSFGPLIVLRILIGAFEAGFYPGVIYYLSCWYTRGEIAKRSSIFVLGSFISGAFSGFIAYGVVENLDGVGGKAAWRWLFIIEGVTTVGVGFIAIMLLPSLPQNTRWLLTKEERLVGVMRLLEDVKLTEQEQDECEEGRTVVTAKQGVIMALRDPKVLNFIEILFCIAGTASINTVFPTIVESLGYTYSKTLLLTAPPWILCAITCYSNSFHSDRTQERFWHMVWGPALSVVGFAIGLATTKTAPRYVAIMILLQIYNSWGVAFAWVTSTLNQPPIKRAAAIAIINIGFNLPNVFMAYLFTTGDSPKFVAGFSLCLCFAVFSMVGCVVMRFQIIRANKRLEQGYKVDGMDGSTGFRFPY
ncbi:major facilitator superfamily domain-containing protein [Limtongia smithiae]|uniref:major facilitator superfamily domain-containing protein n=1 Tax=Limtongia smithiae TaxID=1125753 RepID=UPI0034CDFCD2